MDWHISRARYNKGVNLVAEDRVLDFVTYEEGIKYLDQHQSEPLYLWHTNAAELDYPPFAMVETENYKREYQKVID